MKNKYHVVEVLTRTMFVCDQYEATLEEIAVNFVVDEEALSFLELQEDDFSLHYTSSLGTEMMAICKLITE